MTYEDLEPEVTKSPFMPFRLHLVSGKTFDVLYAHAATLLSQTLLVLRNPKADARAAEGYDLIAYSNIERVEQLDLGKSRGISSKSRKK
jgi:hypothetical protein